jgi:hypothetical protein
MNQIPEINESPQKSTIDEVLAQLTDNQLRFVTAMQNCTSKSEAAKEIGIEPNTAYKWPDVVDEAIRLTRMDVESVVRAVRKRNLLKAMMVKVAGLDSPNEDVRQKVATEIIEGELGKPTQHSMLTGADGGAVKTESAITIYLPDNGRD